MISYFKTLNLKSNKMKHLVLLGIMWLCGLMTVVAQNVPQVIPALQQWKPAKGKMVLPESGKVIISSDEEGALKQSAEILVQDLKEKFFHNQKKTCHHLVHMMPNILITKLKFLRFFIQIQNVVIFQSVKHQILQDIIFRKNGVKQHHLQSDIKDQHQQQNH